MSREKSTMNFKGEEMEIDKDQWSLVLDLDNCLIHSVFKKESIEEIKKEISKKEHLEHRSRFYNAEGKETYCGLKRPGLDKFLHFAEKYFDTIIVWSAGTMAYIKPIVNFIFKGHRYPKLVLSRDQLHYGETPEDYYKPLEVVAKYINIDTRRTVFLDDKLDNFRKDPGNGFNIPVYKAKKGKRFSSSDEHLYSLMEWLMQDKVRQCQDIRLLDKTDVFTLKYTGKHESMCAGEHLLIYAPVGR